MNLRVGSGRRGRPDHHSSQPKGLATEVKPAIVF